MGNRAALTAVTIVTVAMLAGCVPAGPPTLEQVADEFDDTITPTWRVEVPGIYGEPAVAGGVIAVYAQDPQDTMRLEVRDAENGELLWDHVASPGGAWGAPLFSETDSPSRRYPIPAVQPFIATRGTGDDARRVVIFTERLLTETNEFINADILHVADLLSGDELEVTAPDYVEYESEFGDAEVDDDGNVLIDAYSPFRSCEDGAAACAEDTNGGLFRVDLDSLEVTNTEPDFDPWESSMSRDFGNEYVFIVPKEEGVGFQIARIVDGEERWRVTESDLFPDGGGAAEKRDFRLVGDLLLIQGYRSITTNLDTNVFSYDYAASRTLVALDPDSGEVRWTARNADSLCVTVDDYPLPADPDVISVCHATGGSFEYDGNASEMIEETPPDVSIAGLDLSDGSLTWEVEHAGDQAILLHGRQLNAAFSSGPAFAVVDVAAGTDAPEVELVDLTSGEAHEVPADSGLMCEAERPGVQLEFQGSVFVSGSNPIALEYPAGWYQFPCDAGLEQQESWTRGAVRAGGISVGDGGAVVVLEDGLAGFRL